MFRWFLNTSDSNIAISVAADANDSVYVAGYSTHDTVVFAKYSSWTNKYFNCSPFGIRHDPNSIPKEFLLFQNYPNPFNPVTLISYQIPFSTYVQLTIYDINGQAIAKPVNEKQDAGNYQFLWDASNFPSGVYFYKLSTPSYSNSKKMVLLK